MARFAMVGTGAGARPAPKKMAPVLIEIQQETGVVFTSLLRTQPAVNFARKNGAVLSSQKELYDGFKAGRPGYNPANPPGISTHERRSDGVVYSGPVGRPLRYFEVGIDNTNPDAFIAAAKKRGWIVVRPYSSPLEAHHVNFQKEPVLRKPLPALKQGSKGSRVLQLERRLRFIRDRSGKPYFTGKIDRNFGPVTMKAVRGYQKDRGLKVDGVVGKHTWAQITVDFRRQWRKRKSKTKPKRGWPRRHPAAVPTLCVNFVAEHEGFYSRPYNDPVGHATIGFGHLLHLGPVTQADRDKWGALSRRQALNLLRSDLREAAAAVRRLVKVPLNRRQFSALVSFTFNCGVGALAESTLLKKLNAGNYAAVPGELNRWVYAGGVKLPGLVTRRRREGEMFRPLKKPNPKLWR